jgi:O-acetylhomoserine (thiol)-lyase
VGSETLNLRLAQCSETALTLAKFLQAHPAVDKVHYPSLETHAQHGIVKKLFRGGSWLMAFELRDETQVLPVLNRLRIPIKATGLGDTRTLVIPVAPTIFWEAGREVRAQMGIAEGLVRVSVGLEDAEDLIADFDQALAGG